MAVDRNRKRLARRLPTVPGGGISDRSEVVAFDCPVCSNSLRLGKPTRWARFQRANREWTMFEEEILLGDTERRIALQTRKGRDIPNYVAPDPGEQAQRKYEALRKRYGLLWKNRKGPCGGYNCYGMVFASRRTAISEDERIPDILEDDGFRCVSEQDARPGDIVFYRDRKYGRFHVALVMRREQGTGSMSALFALSKWNDAFGEDEHNVAHHCWPDDPDIKIEFWTERPAP